MLDRLRRMEPFGSAVRMDVPPFETGAAVLAARLP